VSDGTHTAGLNFNGSYTLANFKFSDDGHGGTLVIDPPAPAAIRQPIHSSSIRPTDISQATTALD